MEQAKENDLAINTQHNRENEAEGSIYHISKWGTNLIRENGWEIQCNPSLKQRKEDKEGTGCIDKEAYVIPLYKAVRMSGPMVIDAPFANLEPIPGGPWKCREG